MATFGILDESFPAIHPHFSPNNRGYLPTILNEHIFFIPQGAGLTYQIEGIGPEVPSECLLLNPQERRNKVVPSLVQESSFLGNSFEKVSRRKGIQVPILAAVGQVLQNELVLGKKQVGMAWIADESYLPSIVPQGYTAIANDLINGRYPVESVCAPELSRIRGQ